MYTTMHVLDCLMTLYENNIVKNLYTACVIKIKFVKIITMSENDTVRS